MKKFFVHLKVKYYSKRGHSFYLEEFRVLWVPLGGPKNDLLFTKVGSQIRATYDKQRIFLFFYRSSTIQLEVIFSSWRNFRTLGYLQEVTSINYFSSQLGLRIGLLMIDEEFFCSSGGQVLFN